MPDVFFCLQGGLDPHHESDLVPPPFQLIPVVWLRDLNKCMLEAESMNTGPHARV